MCSRITNASCVRWFFGWIILWVFVPKSTDNRCRWFWSSSSNLLIRKTIKKYRYIKIASTTLASWVTTMSIITVSYEKTPCLKWGSNPRLPDQKMTRSTGGQLVVVYCIFQRKFDSFNCCNWPHLLTLISYFFQENFVSYLLLVFVKYFVLVVL